MLWGSTFPVTKSLIAVIPPADMIATRFVIASVVLVAVSPKSLRMSRATLKHGMVMGFFYAAGLLCQTMGLVDTRASVSGFLTGLYVVLTPLTSAIVLRLRLTRRQVSAAGLAAVGLSILTLMPDALDGGLGQGELLTLLGAFFFAGHIVYTGQVATPEASMSLTVTQMIVLAAVCTVVGLPGGIVLPSNWSQWGLLLYLTIFCSAVALFLQIWAQAHVPAIESSVIMSTEPVWATTFAVLGGQETLTGRVALGGLVMISAMLLAATASLPVKEHPEATDVSLEDEGNP